MKIQWTTTKRKLNELVPSQNNPRKLTEKQYDDLKKSLTKFDLAEIPAINTDNTILAGHQRLRILTELDGLDREIDVRVPNRQLTEEEAREYLIRSNKNLGEWDWEILKNDFDQSDLIDWGFEEIDFGLEPEETQGDDDVPEAGEKVITKPGDLYELGSHRLLCGDSTVATDVEKALGGQVPILMVTDPPYGVEYDPKWRDGLKTSKALSSIGTVKNDDSADWGKAYSLFPGDICYVWHSGNFTHIVSQNLQDCGFVIINPIIWAKSMLVMGRGNYHWKHEHCWYAVRKDKNHNWQGSRTQTTVWEIDSNHAFLKDKEKTWGHSTQKPIPCMQIPILNNSKKGEFVYDPFAGTGTTLIACEKNKRNCLTIEIDPGYVDICVKRYIEFCKANKITPKVTKNGENCTEFD
jgi:DNA modification methylase